MTVQKIKNQNRVMALSIALALALAIGLIGSTTSAHAQSNGWSAVYYNTTDLTGPVVRQETFAGSQLNVTWPADVSPGFAVEFRNFSARFTHNMTVSTRGNVNFKLSADDGARLYVNGVPIIDVWDGQAHGFYYSRVLTLDPGSYTLVVDYREFAGDRSVSALYEFTNDSVGTGDDLIVLPNRASTPIPPTLTPSAFSGGWSVDYYDTNDLSGPVIRSSSAPGPYLDVTWGADDSPIFPVEPFDWSARFVTTATFPKTGNYNFKVLGDDGARLYVGGTLVLDAWNGQAHDFFLSRVLKVEAGTYTIQVQYREGSGARRVAARWEFTQDPVGFADEFVVISGGTPPDTSGASGGTGSAGGTGTGSTGGTGTGTGTSAAPGTSSSVGVAAVPPSGGITLDEIVPFFSWSGTQDWEVGRGGFSNNRYLYTDNSQFGLRMWGRWNANIQTTGNYDVYVYIPNHPGATSNARYRVFHANILSPAVVVDQQANAGSWVYIGTYRFNAGGTQYVYLNDLTFETSGTRDVVYDAVKIIPSQ